MQNRITVFSCYLEAELLPFHVEYYLTFLRPHSDRLVFLYTGVELIDSDALLKVETLADEVMFVENNGFDFGMWQRYLNLHNIERQFQEICLVNDSCICFGPLNAFFDWHDANEFAVSGATMSFQRATHLQSFLMVVKSSAVMDAVSFLRKTKVLGVSFEEVITNGEIGFSGYMLDRGHKLGGFFTPRFNFKVNTAIFCCADVPRHGLPLVKRKLLKEYKTVYIRALYQQTRSCTYEQLLYGFKKQYQISDEVFEQLFSPVLSRVPSLHEGLRIVLWRTKYKLRLSRVKDYDNI